MEGYRYIFRSTSVSVIPSYPHLRFTSERATEIEILAADFPTNSSAGEVDVEVSTTGGTAVLTDGFEYVVAP